LYLTYRRKLPVFTQLAKTGGILAATVLSAILAALVGDQAINPTEWINVFIGAAGVLAVYVVPNVAGSSAAYAKGFVAALSAVLVLLQSLISDGVSGTEWVQLALAALGALGVVGLPGPMVTPRETVSRRSTPPTPPTPPMTPTPPTVTE
jgi:drug/metabolite transporter (DMT)-like permease